MHILSKHGVLISFNLAKKVKKTDIKKIRDELKKTCKNNAELNEKLQNMIILQIKNSLREDEIPGVIQEDKKKKIKDPYESIPMATKQKIILLANELNKEIQKEHLTFDAILILIQLILMESGIKQDDIKKFNKKYNLKPNKDIDYINEDDVDDDELDDDDFDDDDFDDGDKL